MNPQRRTLLKAAGLTSAATSAGLTHAAMTARRVQDTLAHTNLMRNHFTPLEGQTFEFRKPDGTCATAVLQVASPLPGSEDGEASFRLVFQTTENQHLEQDTWEVSHPALGSHAIFVSPNDPAGREVEAVFNRLLRA